MLWARQGPREHVGQRSGSMTSYTVQGLTQDCADGASKETPPSGGKKQSARLKNAAVLGSPTRAEINVELTYPLRGRGWGWDARRLMYYGDFGEIPPTRGIPREAETPPRGWRKAELRGRPGGTTPSRPDACQRRLLLP